MSAAVAGASGQTGGPARWLRIVLVVVAVLLIAAPMVLLFINSLKSQVELFSDPIGLPRTPAWDNFARAWTTGGVAGRALNSIGVTAASVALSTGFGAGAGYVCARLRQRRLAAGLTALFAFGLFIPVQSALVPLFAQMQALGLLGTLAPIILVDTALQLPLSVLIFAGFFAALPVEVEESAMVDGANRFRVLASIVVPLARPAVATSAILGTVTVWNDYFVALVFSIDESTQTLPVGLAAFRNNFSTDWPGTLAYSAIIAVPVFCLYVGLQRYITDGVQAGAVRG